MTWLILLIVMTLLGDRMYCEWRQDFIKDTIDPSDPTQIALEKEQLSQRLEKIMADLLPTIPQVNDDGQSELMELVLKPAYAVLRAAKSSRTAFHFARLKCRYNQSLRAQESISKELAQTRLRNVYSGDNVGMEAVGRLLVGLYPALLVNEGGDKMDQLVQPVMLVS